MIITKFIKKNNIAALIAIASILLMILAGCGSKQEAPTAQLANPMTEVTLDEMVEKTGVPLHFPERAEDVHYFTIAGENNTIAEMDFTLNGKAYTYRAVAGKMDVQELSGVYFTNCTESYAEVSYAEGKFLTESKTSVLYWEDVVPGVCYSLTCTDCDNPIVLLEIAERTFVPLQGDGVGYAEVPTEYPDLEGTFTDGNNNTVEVVAAGDNKSDGQESPKDKETLAVGVHRYGRPEFPL